MNVTVFTGESCKIRVLPQQSFFKMVKCRDMVKTVAHDWLIILRKEIRWLVFLGGDGGENGSYLSYVPFESQWGQRRNLRDVGVSLPPNPSKFAISQVKNSNTIYFWRAIHWVQDHWINYCSTWSNLSQGKPLAFPTIYCNSVPYGFFKDLRLWARRGKWLTVANCFNVINIWLTTARKSSKKC